MRSKPATSSKSNLNRTNKWKNGSAMKPKKAHSIFYRCSPGFLLCYLNRLSDEQKNYVRKIGFGSLLSMAKFELNRDLTLWLVDQFNCDTEALEFESGISIPVRPLVKSVLGIPSGTIEVVQDSHVDDDLYRRFSDWQTVYALGLTLNTITEEEPFCIAFMMVILGFYLAPGEAYDINKSFLGVAQQVGNLSQMDWCNFTATYLFKGIREFKREFKESDAPCVYLKGCLHILSVIFIDFVKHVELEVPDGFPRLGVVTNEHNNWVASHAFRSLTLRRQEESVYASVFVKRLDDNITEDGECPSSEAINNALDNQFATTDTDQNNNNHSVSAELGTAITTPNATIVEHVALQMAPQAADREDTHTRQGSVIITTIAGNTHHHSMEQEHRIAPRDDEQLRSNVPSSEPYAAQIKEGMQVTPDASVVRKRGSPLTMENDDRNAKKARVKRAGVEISLLNCPICFRPLKPPVFQCNGGHLACATCLANLPGGQCPTCEHGGGFGPCRPMDVMVSSARIKCSHEGCQSYVIYHELEDHRSACPHAPCFCTEPGCGFAGPPLALLRHLTGLHSWPVHNIVYGKVLGLQVPVSEQWHLLLAEDDSVFLLVVGALGGVTTMSMVCIRAGASPQPEFSAAMRAYGPPPPSTAAGIRCAVDTKSLTSSTRPGKVAAEKLPFILLVPPTHVFGAGPSKEVSLKIRIDKM